MARWLEERRRDMRLALRSLARTPGFTLVAIFVIAAGIGVNTAVFSVVNAVLLKPLTYPDSKSLLRLVIRGDRGAIPVASIPEYNLWRQQSAIFQQVAAYDWGGAGMNLSGRDRPEQVRAMHVTSRYFTMFGAPLVAGRAFTEAEDRPNAGHFAVLSYGLWQRRFGGDSNVVGSVIRMDDRSWLVVGVAGPDFVTDTPIDLWIPFQFDLTSQAMARNFNVAARLKPGVSIDQVNARLALVTDQFRRIHGTSALPPHDAFGAIPLQEALTGSTRVPLMILLGAVGLVLLIACANVANLLLSRTSSRSREFATRAALGASRGQILRQLLSESLLLSFSGGLGGLAIGVIGVRLLLRISPSDIPRIGENASAVGLDPCVLLFTLGVSLVTGFVFGLAPAILASRTDLLTSLHDGSGRSGTGSRQSKVRSVLVISEVALALVLVIGAALLIRTFIKLQEVQPGFITQNVLSASMSLNASRFQTTGPVAQLVRDGRERLMAVPGVLEAGVSNCLPLQGCFGMGFDVLGRPKGDSPTTGVAGFFSVSWSYFQTFEIPLLRGRTFNEQDGRAAPGVVIINQALAQRYWPDGNPLQDRILIGGGGPALDELPRQIVGIVGDTRDAGISRDPFPTMYVPIAQMPDAQTAMNSRVVPLWWIVRTRMNPHDLRAPIEAALRDASGGLPVGRVRTMDEVASRSTARQRFNMLLLLIFAAAGLLMAAVGVYGVMSYSIQQRTREFGIRMALGAQPSKVRSMAIGQGMVLAGAGMILGLGGAFWLTRFLTSFLFGVTARDPLAFLIPLLVLGAIALFAVWVPASRATRIDPVAALRLE